MRAAPMRPPGGDSLDGPNPDQVPMVTDNADVKKQSPSGRARGGVDDADPEKTSGGLPGRPMALLIAIGLALLSALIVWLATGGAAALFGR